MTNPAKLMPQADTWQGQISNILEEEANRLAEYEESNRADMPHRVRIALLREVKRLRELSDQLAMSCQPPTFDGAQ